MHARGPDTVTVSGPREDRVERPRISSPCQERRTRCPRACRSRRGTPWPPLGAWARAPARGGRRRAAPHRRRAGRGGTPALHTGHTGRARSEEHWVRSLWSLSSLPFLAWGPTSPRGGSFPTRCRAGHSRALRFISSNHAVPETDLGGRRSRPRGWSPPSVPPPWSSDAHMRRFVAGACRARHPRSRVAAYAGRGPR